MKHIIKRLNGEVITEGESVSAAIQDAVKQSMSLYKANLRYVDLREAEAASLELAFAKLISVGRLSIKVNSLQRNDPGKETR